MVTLTAITVGLAAGYWLGMSNHDWAVAFRRFFPWDPR